MWKRGLKLLQAAGGEGQQHHIAIALRKGKVVGVGYNSYRKTHPKQSHFARLAGEPKREYLHAEIACLLHLSSKPDTMYVLRTNKSGGLACSKPCNICRLAINSVNPNMKVFHS